MTSSRKHNAIANAVRHVTHVSLAKGGKHR